MSVKPRDDQYGSSADETFAGGAGNDYIVGGDGSDTYVYASGDGNDQIFDENTTPGGVDTLRLTNLNASDVTLRRDGAHLFIRDNLTGKDITILYQYHAPYDQGIERLEFADGTVWNADDIRTEVNALVKSTGRTLVQGTPAADTLTGTSGDDLLIGLSGTDAVNGSAGDDYLVGGGGNDTLDGGFGVDVALFSGNQGGYTLATSGGTTTITDNQPGTDGDDGVDTLVGVEKAEFDNGVQVGLAAPIVLDLDRNGVSLIDRDKSKTNFDWDMDGRADRTGWISKGDAFLVLDRNGDGKVSGASELSFVNDTPGAKSDLDGLSAHDSNGDGILSVADEAFGRFRVWRDANSNGRSDKGELTTLAAAGIASLDLIGTPVDQAWGWSDNVTVHTGFFTRPDGSRGGLADVALNYATGSRSSNSFVAAAQLAQAIAGFESSGTTDLSLHDVIAQHGHMLSRPYTAQFHQ